MKKLDYILIESIAFLLIIFSLVYSFIDSTFFYLYIFFTLIIFLIGILSIYNIPIITKVKYFLYITPLIFLGYILYLNYLPFGYNKVFTIDVGSKNDTSGVFRIEPSKVLSEKKINKKNETYRSITGITNLIFEPNVVLKNTKVIVTIDAENVNLIPSYFDINSILKWDKEWDFTKNIPNKFTGNAFFFDNYIYFNGESFLELPESYNQFEKGPFSVYVEWMPEEIPIKSQQIIGHFNWEILQHKNFVEFRIGRTIPSKEFYSIKAPIQKEFFHKKHSLLAVYSPFKKGGYIEVFLDQKLIQRLPIYTEVLNPNYGGDIPNLRLGQSLHGGGSEFFKGRIYDAKFSYKRILDNIITFSTEITINDETPQFILPIDTEGIGILRSISIEIQ